MADRPPPRMPNRPGGGSGGGDAELRRQVLALAREVESLRRAVEGLRRPDLPDSDTPPAPAAGILEQDRDELRRDVSQLAAQVDELRSAVAAVADQGVAFAELAAQVHTLTTRLAPPDGDSDDDPDDGIPVPVDWQQVPAEQAPELLTELAAWISGVLEHHRSAHKLAPCWYHHPGLVQFLLDLYGEWRYIYRAEDPGPSHLTRALDWHSRHLAQLEVKIKEAFGMRCTGLEHKEPDWRRPVRMDPAALTDYARWWTSGQDPATKPPPVLEEPIRPAGAHSSYGPPYGSSYGAPGHGYPAGDPTAGDPGQQQQPYGPGSPWRQPGAPQ